MEQKLHRMIVAIFVLQLALSLFSSFGRPVLTLITNINFKIASFLGFVGQSSDEIKSYQSTTNNFVDGFRYFLLLSTLIPISLVVNLEVVRILQVGYQKMNYSMKSLDKDRGFSPNSASVNEELGQIEYILTDKTGTLTQNKMVLRGIFIGDCYFGGEFTTDGPKKVFEPFIVQERQRRRVLEDLEDAFDRRLIHTVVLGDDAPLPQPVSLSFHPVRISIPDQPCIAEKNAASLVRLNQLTLTNMIRAHNLDMSSDDDLHKNIIISRSRRNILERSEDESRSILLNEDKKRLNEEEIGEGFIPMSDLEDGTNPKDRSQNFIHVSTPKTPREHHFETDDSRLSSPINSRLNSPNIKPTSGNLNMFNLYKNQIPDTIIVESPDEDEGMILKSYQDIIVEFLMCASICHDCVVERNVSQKLTYHGPSPDEIAICKGSNLIGCKFLSKDSLGQCELEIFGEERRPIVKIVR
jgi:magnesium-transporting ATPase (P-type)